MARRLVPALLLTSALSPRSAQGAFDLPFGDVNVVAVTDVHSWVAGHKHEPRFNADYGDVLSFYQRMQEECDREGRDLFFVMNGDINDGTALGEDPPTQLVPLLERMPWDAVTVGNHELYHNDFISYITQPGGFVEHWGDRYLTANVLNASIGAPLGRTHKFLEGRHGARVLALGFLYNMDDHDSLVEVVKVEDVVQQQWFRDLLSGSSGAFDAVLILGHMDCHDPLVSVILRSIREVQPTVPVQFITGHSHERKYARLEPMASSFEAGHYLDTVGFVSFPRHSTAARNSSARHESGFEHVFIDANVGTFRAVSGLDVFTTKAGLELTQAITDTREKMGVSECIGCAPMFFNSSAALRAHDSLWRLYLEEVIVDGLFERNRSRVFVQSSGTLRYDLYQGNVTKDDILTMSPFPDAFWLLGHAVPGSIIKALLAKLNNQSRSPIKVPLPDFLSTPFDESGTYELYGGTYDVGSTSKPGHLLEALLDLDSNKTLQPYHGFAGQTTATLWTDFVKRVWPCELFYIV